MNLDDNIFEDYEDDDDDMLRPSDEDDVTSFEQTMLEHLFSMRLTMNTKTNYDILRDRTDDESLPAKDRDEARKWLHKLGEETVEYFRNNVFISVLINGRKICNMCITENEKEEVVNDMASHIPPVQAILQKGVVTGFNYTPLKSIDIILETKDD